MSHPPRAAEAVAHRHLEVERLSRSGCSIAEICNATGLSRTSVVRIKNQRGLSKPQRRQLTTDEIERAKALLDDGASIAEVVRTLGCGRSQIDDRFPGRAWPLSRTLEHQKSLRKFVGNHSADSINALWALKKAQVSV